ncbi:MAG TPA: NAD(P)-dependent oxidoreductase [Chloroflexota bacterium]|nr:NAD(P)-dependent oxidoreductase [Chloroflexota bacterium]
MTQPLVLVAENDPFLRMFQVILDPSVTDERRSAFAYFFSHDLPDFDGWIERMRDVAGPRYPAEVRLVDSREEMHVALDTASVLVVESLEVGPSELAVAPDLQVVQKFGALPKNVDLEACAGRNVRVLTQRRRANISCAEHIVAMMLTLARKLHRIGGLISVQQLQAAGYEPGTFDRRHTAMSGWPRVSGLSTLYEASLGIIGMGEIGQELALRIAPFGMDVRYYQRRRLSSEDEARLQVRYAELDELLAQSDWVCVQLPLNNDTRGFVNRDRLARMKPGANLINVSRAEIVDREALLDALHSGHLGGFGLDPLYKEPGRADDPLLTFPNVFLTPHTAAQPRFNTLRDTEDMLRGIAGALAG